MIKFIIDKETNHFEAKFITDRYRYIDLKKDTKVIQRLILGKCNDEGLRCELWVDYSRRGSRHDTRNTEIIYFENYDDAIKTFATALDFVKNLQAKDQISYLVETESK